MGPKEAELWNRWSGEILTRTREQEVGSEFEIKNLFEQEWDVAILGHDRNLFGSMFQKALRVPEIRANYAHLEHLGVKENGDNHEWYRRIE